MVKKNTGKSSENDEFETIPDGADDIELEEIEGQSDAKIKKLRDSLRACEAEKRQYLDGWQREKADLMNIRKRHAEEIVALKDREAATHIEKLLPLCDSFEMAFSDTETWANADPKWKKGIEQIHAQLEGILKNYAVEPVGEVGEAFNPHLHEAVSNAPVEDEKLNHTIVTVYQKGYRVGEQLIRPAKVIVGEFTD